MKNITRLENKVETLKREKNTLSSDRKFLERKITETTSELIEKQSELEIAKGKNDNLLKTSHKLKRKNQNLKQETDLEKHDLKTRITELEKMHKNKKDCGKVERRSSSKSKLDVTKKRTKRVGLKRKFNVERTASPKTKRKN